MLAESVGCMFVFTITYTQLFLANINVITSSALHYNVR